MKKFEVGAVVTLVLAIVGGIFYLGKLEGRVQGIAAGTDISRQKEDALLQIEKTIEVFRAEEGGPEVPVGSIVAFSGRFAPDVLERLHKEGWLPCNGEAIHESNFPKLYKILGGAYGRSSDGGYLLPDLQGRVPMGAGQGPGLQLRERGETPGLDNHTLTEDQLPTHTHIYYKPDRNGDVVFDTFAEGDGENAKSRRTETGSKGSGREFSIIQPSLVVNFVIKAR